MRAPGTERDERIAKVEHHLGSLIIGSLLGLTGPVAHQTKGG
jgi:hypothetical protein